MKSLLIITAMFMLTATLQAQAPIKNPTAVLFTCPDHALDDQHELDIIRVSDMVVVQTILGGDPPADAAGDVRININVQPVAFGQYTIRVRAVAGALKSDNSAPTAIWERAPGAPTKTRVQ